MSEKNELGIDKPEPVRAEDNYPIPVIIWVIFFSVIIWGVFYMLSVDQPIDKEIRDGKEYLNALDYKKEIPYNQSDINHQNFSLEKQKAEKRIRPYLKSISEDSEKLREKLEKKLQIIRESESPEAKKFLEITKEPLKTLIILQNTEIWKKDISIMQTIIRTSSVNQKMERADWQSIQKFLIYILNND